MELRFACCFTSLVTGVQLFLGIKSFQRDLITLHKARHVFGSLIANYDMKKYAKIIKRRNRLSDEITSDSIHYPGYLIAHLVYGYVVLYMGVLMCTLVAKLFFYFPKLFYALSQLLLPLIIMVILKLVIVQCLTRFVFLNNNSYRISKSVPYHVFSYFNFFLD